MKHAIFDLDGTILAVNSWPAYYRRCWTLRPVGAPKLIWATALRALGVLDGRGLREVALGCLRGKSRDAVREAGQKLWAESLRNWVRPAARLEIERRRAAGYAVGVATGAFDFIAEAAARDLGLEVWAGTRLEYSGGLCSGRIHGAETRGEAKAAAVRAALAGRDVDWAGSIAFSDDWEDLPLWRMTGDAVWVRPEGRQRGRDAEGVAVRELTWRV